MKRSLFLLVVTMALLSISAAQEPKYGTLPPGPRGGPVEVIQALFVQAQMLDKGEVMFCFPRGDQIPALFAQVDGTEVRAYGRDLQPLNVDELNNRLAGYTSVAVVQAEFELPDAFFLKVLHERSVVFVLPKKMFAPMVKAAESRRAPGAPVP